MNWPLRSTLMQMWKNFGIPLNLWQIVKLVKVQTNFELYKKKISNHPYRSRNWLKIEMTVNDDERNVSYAVCIHHINVS